VQEYTDKLKSRYVDSPIKWATLGGLVLLIIGVFGPWATVSFMGFSSSISGTDGEFWGIFVLILSVLALAAVLVYAFANVNIQHRQLLWGLVIVAVVIDLMVLWDFIDVLTTDLVGVGWGLWLALIGAIALSVGAIVPMKDEIGAKANEMRSRNDSTPGS
jgi:hypothetical protein